MNNLPRVHLAHLPTAVEAMPRLTATLGGPELLIKRDDQTGLAMGGNKTRKLELLAADAQANGARTLITAGATQSNHCRQTAAAARRCGLECILVLYPPTPQEAIPADNHPTTGNLLLDHLFGAEIVWTLRQDREQTLKDRFQAASEAGKRPYLIPYGGSNAIGAAAYALAMQEFIAQNQPVDWIVFPSSSGGTQAGLALGKRLFGFSGKVLGISVDESAQVLQQRVASLAMAAGDLLGEKQVFEPQDILVNADYLGGGYGVMGTLEQEAIRLFAHNEGILLDPVYTGRAAGGMIDLIRQGAFKRSERLLFWHTGGSPALFAERYQDQL
jgi:D-cysteine desulfhydrase